MGNFPGSVVFIPLHVRCTEPVWGETMKIVRVLALMAFTSLTIVGLGEFGAPVTAADTKADKKADRLKAKEEAKKKAEEAAKKAEEVKKADEANAAEKAKFDAEIAKKKSAEAAANRPAVSQDASAIAKLIDVQIDARLKRENIAPSPLSSDADFLRRVYLDITGVIPSFEKAKAFLDDKSTNKREQLIDDLLADSNYGRKQADIWGAKLFTVDSANRYIQKEPFAAWLKDQFNKNTPWNEFVSSIVTASGPVDENPAVTYFLSNRSIDKLTDTTGQHFLGIRVSCAQCHNHPFTTTKQTEYWGLAAFYSKVKSDKVANGNKGGDNSKIGVTEGNVKSKAKDFFPESAKTVPAKFFGGAEPKLTNAEPYRPALAKWLTSAENPYFAKAMVNRTWASLFGNGIVDPVDDMIEKNKPSHPELLDELTRKFTAGGFDVKYLIKGIVLSQAYQRTSKPSTGNKADDQLFSHMAVKMMTAEELFDSLTQVTGVSGNEAKKTGTGVKGVTSGPRANFVNFYVAGAEEFKSTEYEAGIPQALRLMNSRIAGNPAALKQFGTGKPADVIEKMYITTLSRRPTDAEIQKLTAHLGKAGSTTEAYGDILWALLNSSEFSMVR